MASCHVLYCPWRNPAPATLEGEDMYDNVDGFRDVLMAIRAIVEDCGAAVEKVRRIDRLVSDVLRSDLFVQTAS